MLTAKFRKTGKIHNFWSLIYVNYDQRPLSHSHYPQINKNGDVLENTRFSQRKMEKDDRIKLIRVEPEDSRK